MSTRSWLSGPSRVWTLLRRLPEAIVVVDHAGTILWANEAAEVLSGYALDHLVGRSGFDLIDPDDHEIAAGALARVLDSGGVKQPWPLRIVQRSGARVSVEMLPANLLDVPSINAVVITIRPLAGDRVAAWEREIEGLFQRAFEEAPIGMAMVARDHRLTRPNAAFAELVGRPPSQLIGIDVRSLTHPDDVAREQPLLEALLAGHVRSYQLDKRLLRADGEVWVSCSVSLVPLPDGEGERFVLTAEDVSARKVNELSATHDPATGLANRVLLDDRLDIALARTARVASSVGLIRCHVDGEEAEVVEVAGRVKGAVRPGDTVARTGPDDLAVVCEDLTAETELAAMAARVARAAARPLAIGLAISSGAESREALFRLAEPDVG